MTSLDALLEAAQFLEHRNTPGSKARGAGEGKTSNAGAKNGSNGKSKENGKVDGASNSPKSADDELKIARRPGGHGTRDMHNKLEKNRRAHLKDCFDNLRIQIPGMEDKKTSNLAILRAALRHINALKRREKELEMFMQHMAREKLLMQEKIVILKQELQDLHVDVDLNSFLKSIQETDNMSQSTATADGEDPILSDDDDDPDKVPQPIMCVTVEGGISSPTQLNAPTNQHALSFYPTTPMAGLTPVSIYKQEAMDTSPSTSSTTSAASELASPPATVVSFAVPIGSPAPGTIRAGGISGKSRPNPLSITNPQSMNISRMIAPKTMTLFSTSSAGQIPGGPSPGSSPVKQSANAASGPKVVTGVLSSPPASSPSRPPVTQILQQQLAQRALQQQAKMQLAAAAAAAKTEPSHPSPAPILLQAATAAGLPQVITLNPSTLRGLTNDGTGGSTISVSQNSAPVTTTAMPNLTISQLPQIVTTGGTGTAKLATLGGVGSQPLTGITMNPASTPLASPNMFKQGTTAIPLNQLFPQLVQGATVLSLATPQQQASSSIASVPSQTPTLLSLAPVSTTSAQQPHALSLTSSTAAAALQQQAMIAANTSASIASITKLVSTVGGSSTSTLSTPSTPTSQPVTIALRPMVQPLQTAQFITTAQLQALLNQSNTINLASLANTNLSSSATPIVAAASPQKTHTPVVTLPQVIHAASAGQQGITTIPASQLMSPMTVVTLASSPGLQISGTTSAHGLQLGNAQHGNTTLQLQPTTHNIQLGASGQTLQLGGQTLQFAGANQSGTQTIQLAAGGSQAGQTIQLAPTATSGQQAQTLQLAGGSATSSQNLTAQMFKSLTGGTIPILQQQLSLPLSSMKPLVMVTLPSQLTVAASNTAASSGTPQSGQYTLASLQNTTVSRT